MLEHYLEPKIRRKIRLCSLLFTLQRASMQHLADLIGQSQSVVKEALTEMSVELRDKMVLTMKKNEAAIVVRGTSNQTEIIHAICHRSMFLKCLAFLVTNPGEPFARFTDKYFLSAATAYRIKGHCVNFLERVNLSYDKNRIVGQEYRIRFLIALLSFRFGFDCVDFDERSIDRAYQFIHAASPNFTRQFLKQTPELYGYYARLVALVWLRHNHADKAIYSPDMEAAKQYFNYERFCGLADEVLQPQLPFVFSQADYDYLYLATISVAQTGFETGKYKADYATRQAVMLNKPQVKQLVDLFEAAFGSKLIQRVEFRDAIVEFASKYIGNLQGLVYDRSIFGTSNMAYHKEILALVREIVAKWQQKARIILPPDDNHIEYLCCRIEVLLATLVAPVDIIVCTNVMGTYRMIAGYLDTYFTKTQVRTMPFLLDQPLSQLAKLVDPDTIVLAIPDYRRYLENYVAPSQIIDIHVSFPEINISRIQAECRRHWIAKLTAEAKDATRHLAFAELHDKN